MKKKFLVWLLVISLLGNGWFFYKWQLQENIYIDTLVSNFEKTTHNARFMMGLSPAQISADPTYVGLKLQVISNAFASASDLYHPDIEIPIDGTDTEYLWGLHRILERKYLPVLEKLEYTDQSLSIEDEEILLELASNFFDSGLVGEYEHPAESDLYMQAVKEFLRLEGALSSAGNLKL